ncbi:complement C3-like isoform X1 [Amphiprion ocellaris]|uniref:complement C3-like isoform X1 n=1 Tax=Amphiprion ocellaris TaxID=80972 RepID=UPI00241132AC|nr:complement C3-like isoform X1 [Amphiprion ocellaris]
MPGGCVEQNLASITLPLISTLYLDRSNGWESVGVQRKAEAIQYIRRGYENQLAYRRSGGSCVSVRRIRGTGASTWLPQCQDHSVRGEGVADDGRFAIIGINEQQVCDPLLYLVKNKFRHREKIYVEDNPVYSTTMTGGLCGDDPETTLTAFVHIGPTFVHNALKQAGIHCSSPGVNVEEAIRSTSAYLKRALTKPGRRPYTVAIASYALALDGLPTTLHELLLRGAAPGMPCFICPKKRHIQLSSARTLSFHILFSGEN